jgi:hypothetical protein
VVAGSPPTISEQLSIFERRVTPGDPSERLAADDPVVDLASTFLLNGLVTPVSMSRAGLMPPELLEGVGAWLESGLAGAQDDLYAMADRGRAAPSVEALVGRSIASALPEAYRSWRLGLDLYVVHDAAVYLVGSGAGFLQKQLSSRDLGVLYSPRSTPFLPDNDLHGTVLVIVGVPARLQSLAGLRGARRSLVAAGEALEALRAAGRSETDRRWWWSTEFYDDAWANIVGVDGVERVPLAVGYAMEFEAQTEQSA